MIRIFTFLLCLFSAAVVKGQQEVWWGYYPLGTTQAYATGDEVAQTYHVAVHLPAGYVVPEGGQLSGVRFKLSTMRVGDMKVWMSSALPEGNAADVHLADVQTSDYDDQVRMFVARFNEPVNVPTDGCYVGVTFTVPEISADPVQAIYDENPVCYVREEVAQRDAFFIRSDKFPYWENYGITGKSLLMQVLLSGKLYENAVRPLDFGTSQAVHGETVNVPVTMRSFGTADVSSIDYVVDTRNRKGQEQHYDLPEPLKGLGEKAVVELPFTTDSYTGNVKKTLRITKVNGQPNVDDAKATGALFELTRRVQPRLLFEEFTGTWCVNCPRGMVGLEKLCHDYGDRIVGMAVHNGDPMALAEYGFTGQLIKGYPSALINREYEIDPYYGITDDEPYAVRYPVEWVLENSVAPADMEVQAVWNSDSTAIDVTTHTTFLFDSNTANYALCYVLVADSLHGDPAQGWQQKNGFSGRTSLTDPDLRPWVERPEWVQDLYYNHVAIGVWGAQKGLEASVSAPLQAEVSQTHTHTIPTADNSLVQNKRLLHVAVVLYDTQSGLAVNACQTGILPAGETGIVPSVALSTQQTEQVYDLQGRRVTSSPDVRRSAGLRIVRDADGKTRKLFTY